MKFKIDKKDFLDAIRNINMVVERRNTIAILGNIKIEVTGNELQLFATDLDIEATKTIEVNGLADGVTTVSAQTLSEVVAKLKDGDVELTIKDNDLIVKSGRSRFKLACLDAKDFPVLNDEKYDVSFNIGGGELALLIDNTKFCASTEETRYYLNGVYLHVIDGKLRGVATDGNRMAMHDTEAPPAFAGLKGVIIPNKALVVILMFVYQIIKSWLSLARLRLLQNSLMESSLIMNACCRNQTTAP
jgi:DNA polymerase-3 subunit beta